MIIRIIIVTIYSLVSLLVIFDKDMTNVIIILLFTIPLASLLYPIVVFYGDKVKIQYFKELLVLYLMTEIPIITTFFKYVIVDLYPIEIDYTSVYYFNRLFWGSSIFCFVFYSIGYCIVRAIENKRLKGKHQIKYR